jgi:hypothetical protein
MFIWREKSDQISLAAQETDVHSLVYLNSLGADKHNSLVCHIIHEHKHTPDTARLCSSVSWQADDHKGAAHMWRNPLMFVSDMTTDEHKRI